MVESEGFVIFRESKASDDDYCEYSESSVSGMFSPKTFKHFFFVPDIALNEDGTTMSAIAYHPLPDKIFAPTEALRTEVETRDENHNPVPSTLDDLNLCTLGTEFVFGKEVSSEFTGLSMEMTLTVQKLLEAYPQAVSLLLDPQ